MLTCARSARLMTLMSIVCLSAGSAAAAENDQERLARTIKPAIVTVKFVLKMQGPGGPREIDREFDALMVEKEGLVLCSSVQLGTSKLLRRMSASITPTDIKVLIGEDTEGVDAKLLASDADLDLSWVQIKEPAAKGYDFVDLNNSAEPRRGDDMLFISRMDKFFDRAIKINKRSVSALTKKPRELFVPSGGSQPDPGMPVFNHDGNSVVGIVVVQAPDAEDMGDAATASPQALILPSKEVIKATKRARETAAAEEEEEEDDEGSSSAAEKPQTGHDHDHSHGKDHGHTHEHGHEHDHEHGDPKKDKAED